MIIRIIPSALESFLQVESAYGSIYFGYFANCVLSLPSNRTLGNHYFNAQSRLFENLG